jgi:hypothetical protein
MFLRKKYLFHRNLEIAIFCVKSALAYKYFYHIEKIYKLILKKGNKDFWTPHRAHHEVFKGINTCFLEGNQHFRNLILYHPKT